MAKGQTKQKKPDPCSFIIFGATGDLTHRLVIPALYNLAASDLLPDQFCVAGVARKGVSGAAMRDGFGGHKEPQQHPDPAARNAPDIVKPKAGRS